MAKPALGRGLGALLGGAATAPKAPATLTTAATTTTVTAASPVDPRDRVQHIPLDRIRPCPFQPRKEFNATGLEELAESIRQQGIIQPLIVRDAGTHFELIAGERRWRAAALAGLTEVPVVIRQADDRGVLELALIENLQRENLNPLEEALADHRIDPRALVRDVGFPAGRARRHLDQHPGALGRVLHGVAELLPCANVVCGYFPAPALALAFSWASRHTSLRSSTPSEPTSSYAWQNLPSIDLETKASASLCNLSDIVMPPSGIEDIVSELKDL